LPENRLHAPYPEFTVTGTQVKYTLAQNKSRRKSSGRPIFKPFAARSLFTSAGHNLFNNYLMLTQLFKILSPSLQQTPEITRSERSAS